MDKTVTVKGKVYQIGGLYLNAAEESCTLMAHDGEVFKIEINGMYFDTDELTVIAVMGTIEDAPLELEDGCYYSFIHKGHQSLGVYRESKKGFANIGFITCDETLASDIKKLKVED